MKWKCSSKAGRIFGAAILVLSINKCTSEQQVQQENSAYLEAAIGVGNWLISGSKNSSNRGIRDRLDSDEVTAGLGLGASGHAVFIAELYCATNDSLYLQFAQRSARESLNRFDVAGGFGLYRGLSGIASAAVEVSNLVDDDSLRERARLAFVQISEDSTSWGNVYDLMDGRAGIGLSLLYAWEQFGDDRFRSAAIKLADRLIEVAEPTEGDGLRWMRGEEHHFDLPNFSHGTSGVGYFMARLAEETGEPRFIDAMNRASKYLDHISNRQNGLYLVPYGIPNEGWSTAYDIGWAHGPAGTGRFQYQQWVLDNKSATQDRIRSSVATMLASGMPGPSSDSTIWAGPFSIDRRFGTSGAASFLIDWALVSRSDSLLETAREIVDDILSRATQEENLMYWNQPLYGFQQGEGEAIFSGYFYGAAGYGMLLLQNHLALQGSFLKIRLPDDPFPRLSSCSG